VNFPKLMDGATTITIRKTVETERVMILESV
jgi:hypothetical protein